MRTGDRVCQLRNYPLRTYVKSYYNLPQRTPRTRRKERRNDLRGYRRSPTFIRSRFCYANRILLSLLGVLRALGGKIMLNLRKSCLLIFSASVAFSAVNHYVVCVNPELKNLLPIVQKVSVALGSFIFYSDFSFGTSA